jgi:hypothetical protein
MTEQEGPALHSPQKTYDPTFCAYSAFFRLNAAKLQNKSETQGKTIIFPQRNG